MSYSVVEKSRYNREYQKKNKEKIRLIRRRYNQKHKAQANAYGKLWRKRNPDKKRAIDYRHKYNLDEQTFNAFLLKQNFKCKICGFPFDLAATSHLVRPYVDHNHKTGKVRGLLCHKCNCFLGFAKDSINVLFEAIKYLQESSL